jgi:hypothetical protein
VDVVQVQLALRFTGDTVAGELQTADGETTVFEGWLGLIAAIDAAGLRPRPGAGPRDPATGPARSA